jgi:hypothetical protein
LMAIHDVVAQLLRRNLKLAGQGSLDLEIRRRRTDVEA